MDEAHIIAVSRYIDIFIQRILKIIGGVVFITNINAHLSFYRLCTIYTYDSSITYMYWYNLSARIRVYVCVWLVCGARKTNVLFTYTDTHLRAHWYTAIIQCFGLELSVAIWAYLYWIEGQPQETYTISVNVYIWLSLTYNVFHHQSVILFSALAFLYVCSYISLDFFVSYLLRSISFRRLLLSVDSLVYSFQFHSWTNEEKSCQAKKPRSPLLLFEVLPCIVYMYQNLDYLDRQIEGERVK